MEYLARLRVVLLALDVGYGGGGIMPLGDQLSPGKRLVPLDRSSVLCVDVGGEIDGGARRDDGARCVRREVNMAVPQIS